MCINKPQIDKRNANEEMRLIFMCRGLYCRAYIHARVGGQAPRDKRPPPRPIATTNVVLNKTYLFLLSILHCTLSTL